MKTTAKKAPAKTAKKAAPKAATDPRVAALEETLAREMEGFKASQQHRRDALAATLMEEAGDPNNG